jgi:hypothetical protein
MKLVLSRAISCRDNPGLGAAAHSAHSLTCRSSSVPASKMQHAEIGAAALTRRAIHLHRVPYCRCAQDDRHTGRSLEEPPQFPLHFTGSVFALPELGDPSSDVLSVSLPRPTSGCAALAFDLQGCCGATRMLLSALDGRREDKQLILSSSMITRKITWVLLVCVAPVLWLACIRGTCEGTTGCAHQSREAEAQLNPLHHATTLGIPALLPHS